MIINCLLEFTQVMGSNMGNVDASHSSTESLFLNDGFLYLNYRSIIYFFTWYIVFVHIMMLFIMYYIYVTYFTLYIIWYCILLVSICSMFAFIYCQSSCRSPLKHICEVPRTGTPNVTQILWTAPTQPPICGFVGALSPKCPSLAVLQCFALIDAYTPPTPDIISDA